MTNFLARELAMCSDASRPFPFRAIVSGTSNIMILSQVYEMVDLISIQSAIREKILHAKSLGAYVIIILDSFCVPIDYDVGADQVIVVDFWLWHSHQHVINQQQNIVPGSWNHQADKFLFWTGKPYKPNRVRLLWKFYQKGLLSRCEWSFFLHEDHAIESCRMLLNDISKEAFDDFMSWAPRSCDDNVRTTGTYQVNPYDVNWFVNTKFRVISETHFASAVLRNEPFSQNRPVLSEKTWITILNRSPFIMAGETGSLQKLKNMGFDTFEDTMAIKTYDQIEDDETRLDAIVENVQGWLDDMSDVVRISKGVEHNQQQAIQLANRTEDILLDVIETHKLECSTRDLFIYR